MRCDRYRHDWASLNQTILAQYSTYLRQWIPGGQFEGCEYVLLNPRRCDRRLGSFKINWKTGRWTDFATGDRGETPLSLYAYLTGLPFQQAWLRLTEEIKGSGYVSSPHHSPKGDQTNIGYALKLWNSSFSAEKTVVETYLRSRGITIPLPTDIRLLPGHKHKPSGRIYPVMLTAVKQWPSQDVIAVHRTWILPDGSSKAPISPAKMMLGSTHGQAAQLSASASKMVIAEGIETALTLSQETGFSVWAALSAPGLAALILPERPLGQEIVIACDNDPAGRKAALHAAERWTQEGREVRLAFPPVNCDFNDLLMKKFQ